MIGRKIIGIDVGSCEVAATSLYYDINNKISLNNLTLDKNKHKVIPAAVMFTGPDRKNPKNIAIGEEAVENNSDAESFNYFKESPEHFDECLGLSRIPRSELFSAFFRKLIDNLKTYNGDYLLENDKILLLVGCPSSTEWTKEENNKKYEKLIKEATGVEEVRIVPESRAAMFSVLGSKKNHKVSASEGAAVFDFGSLTADFTYMKSGVGQKEFSWRLGASRIEQGLRKLICMEGEQKAMEEGGRIKPESWAKLDNQLRKFKEKYFDGQLDKNTCKCVHTFTLMDNMGREMTDEYGDPYDIDILLPVNQKNMERVLSQSIIELDISQDGGKRIQMVQGSFKELCRKFFEQAKETLSESRLPLKTIVLTGGASRMGFVKEIAEEVFEGLDIIASENPSFSVSEGLVWVAVADENQKECVEKASGEVLAKPECGLETLKKQIIQYTQDFVYKGVIARTEEWAKDEKDVSINDLIKSMEDWMNKEEVMAEIKQNHETIIDTWKEGTKDALESAVNAQAAEVFSSQLSKNLMIPDDIWNRLQADGLKVDISVEKIVSGLDWNSLGRKLCKYTIVACAIGIGAAVGQIVGAAIGWVAGEILAEVVSDKNKEKPRDKKARGKALKELQKSKSENDIKVGVRAGLEESFHNITNEEEYKESIRRITEIAFEIVTLRRFHV